MKEQTEKQIEKQTNKQRKKQMETHIEEQPEEQMKKQNRPLVHGLCRLQHTKKQRVNTQSVLVEPSSASSGRNVVQSFSKA